MTGATLAALFILGLSVWVVLAMMTLGFFEWLRKPGISVRFSVWIGAFVLVIITLCAPDGKPLASFRTDAISIAITVIVLEELGRYRASLEEKERLIRQIGSQSSDFALEAARIIVNEEWHKDGSLIGAKLRKANLKGVELFDANMEGAILPEAILEEATIRTANFNKAILWKAKLRKAHLYGTSFVGADLRSANLNGAMMVGTNLQSADLYDAILSEADLRGAKLDNAKLYKARYSRKTIWPEGFDYKAAGAILVEWSEDKQDWVLSLKGEDHIDFA